MRRQGRTQAFRWALHGRLPTAVLAVLPPTYRAVAVSGGVIYAADGDTATLRARYGPYVEALGTLNRFFGRPDGPVTVMAQPLGGVGARYPVAVALGDALALVPVGGVDARVNGTDERLSRQASPAPYRAALNDLAVAWWADRLPGQTYAPHMPIATLDLPAAYTDLADRGASGDMMGLLPGYTGAAVAGQRLGQDFYAREMALRRVLDSLQAGDRTLEQLNADHRLNDTLYAGQGPLAARLRALGLGARSTAFSPDGAPALDDLRRAIGSDRLRRLLIALSLDGTVSNNSDSVACALVHVTGQPVIAWMRRYIPLPLQGWGQAQPVGGCR